MKCKKCGSNMVGNGYDTPVHCETLTLVNNELLIEETGTTLIFEADCNPIHCDVIDQDIAKVKSMNQPTHHACLRESLIGIRTALSMLIYTPENTGWLSRLNTNHHAGGVMDHLASLIDSLTPEPGDREPFFPPNR